MGANRKSSVYDQVSSGDESRTVRREEYSGFGYIVRDPRRPTGWRAAVCCATWAGLAEL
jgi:hypothetical protein